MPLTYTSCSLVCVCWQDDGSGDESESDRASVDDETKITPLPTAGMGTSSSLFSSGGGSSSSGAMTGPTGMEIADMVVDSDGSEVGGSSSSSSPSSSTTRSEGDEGEKKVGHNTMLLLLQ